MKKILSPWSKDVKKAMIDNDMDTNDLAEKLNCTRQYVSSIVNGGKYYPEPVIRISHMFKIEVPKDKNATLAKVIEE